MIEAVITITTKRTTAPSHHQRDLEVKFKLNPSGVLFSERPRHDRKMLHCGPAVQTRYPVRRTVARSHTLYSSVPSNLRLSFANTSSEPKMIGVSACENSTRDLTSFCSDDLASEDEELVITSLSSPSSGLTCQQTTAGPTARRAPTTLVFSQTKLAKLPVAPVSLLQQFHYYLRFWARARWGKTYEHSEDL